MGTYLYGIRKLKKARTIVREDGARFIVAHELAYRCKPWLHMRIDPEEARITGQLEHNYGQNWKGLVLYGADLLLWDGSPAWLDCNPLPAERLGVLREDGSCRLPSLRLLTLQPPTLLEVSLWVGRHHAENRLDLYGCRVGDRVEFRGGHFGTHSVLADNDERVRTHWRGYVEVNDTWLKEEWAARQPSPGADPVQPVMTPAAYDHEQCLAAAGWL
jgi:hypothetical protein